MSSLLLDDTFLFLCLLCTRAGDFKSKATFKPRRFDMLMLQSLDIAKPIDDGSELQKSGQVSETGRREKAAQTSTSYRPS